MKQNWLTETEARKKWCPFVRLSDIGYPAFNREKRHAHDPELNPENCGCIASECMAWRWVDGYELGFCGLAAGKP